MPFIWMLSTSLKLPENVITKDIIWFPEEITFGNYIRMLEFPIIRWFLNSGIQAICATTLTVISGAMAGYAFSILKFQLPISQNIVLGFRHFYHLHEKYDFIEKLTNFFHFNF